MTTFTTTDARKLLSDLVSRVEFGKESIGLTRRGRVVAVLIPVEAYEILDDAIDERLLDRARAEDDGEYIPYDEVRKALGLTDPPDVEAGRRDIAESAGLDYDAILAADQPDAKRR